MRLIELKNKTLRFRRRYIYFRRRLNTMHLLLLNGPNLNLLGTREPEIYGAETLADIEQQVAAKAEQLGAQVVSFQSNAEHELIERIHQASHESIDFIVFNPAAYTHTSVALRDALTAVAIPFSEVHISDPEQREPFRQQSFFSDIAVHVVKGLGTRGYLVATEQAIEFLTSQIR